MVFCIICIPRVRTRKRVVRVRAQPGYFYEIRNQPGQPQPCQPQMRNNQQQQQPQFRTPPPPQQRPVVPHISPLPQKNQASAPYPSEPPPPYTRL